MSSLASVANSMNNPSKLKSFTSAGGRQERRTGRRNDKFFSLWHDYNSTPAASKVSYVNCNMLCS